MKHLQKDRRIRSDRFNLLLAALCLVVTLLTGCGIGSGSEQVAYDAEMSTETTAAAMAADYSPAGAAFDYGTEELSLKSVSSDAGEFNTSGVSSSEETGNVSSDAPKEKKLIRTIDLSLETTQFDETIRQIREQITAYDGYIESSGIYYGSDGQLGGRSANITARIPADQTDAFLSSGLGGARIVSRNEQTEDISLKYSDLETRLSSLNTEKTRLLELMEKAEDVESLIALEERLSEIRYETESLQSNLKSYDNRVVYSTVYLYISEVRVMQAARQASFLERVSAGFRESTAEFFEGLEEIAVWFCSNILSIIVFVLLVLAVISVLRKVVARCRTSLNAGRVKSENQNGLQDVQSISDSSERTETQQNSMKTTSAEEQKKEM